MPGVQTCALPIRSEEHTSALQSHDNLVCRLLLEKKKLICERFGLTHQVVILLFNIVVDLFELQPGALVIEIKPALIFFNDTATTEIYTLSLHDALPINDTATTEIYTLSLHDALPISVVAVS